MQSRVRDNTSSTLLYAISLASGEILNSINKITRLPRGVMSSRNCVLDFNYNLNKGTDTLIGVEKNTIINKVVADAVSATAPKILSSKDYNKILIDAVLKSAEPLSSINMKHIEVIQVDTTRLANADDEKEGDQVMTILSSIKEANSEKEIYLNFSQDVKFGILNSYGSFIDDNGVEVKETSSILVVNILKRLRIYNPSYWKIKSITIRLQDLVLLLQKKYEKELEWLLSIDFVTIVGDVNYQVEDIRRALYKKKLKANIICLISLNNDVNSIFNMITNSLEDPKLVIATSNIAFMCPSHFKVIELVTGEIPKRIKPVKIIFIENREVSKIDTSGDAIKLIMKDHKEGERFIYTGDKPLIMARTVDGLNKGRTSLNITDECNVLLYENIEDLNYLLTKKLSLIFSE